MRRSANLSAEKLGRDYLGRVSSAAQRVLPKGDRLLFVGRTRAAIEKKVGPLATADPAKVAEVIAELGDPLTMVKKELERLETAHRGGPPAPVVMWKPGRGEPRPGRGGSRPASDEPKTASDEPKDASDEPDPIRDEVQPSGRGKPGGGEVKPGADEVRPSGDDWKTSKADTEPIPRQPVPPVPPAPPGPPLPASIGSATEQPDGFPPPVAAAPPPPSVRALVRSHPLETVAVLVLGVGGLIFPLVWLAGGMIAALSRVWDVRDKWLAMLAPPLFVLAGLIAAGVLVGGGHGFFGEFVHAFNAYREYLIRAGTVLTAAYLAWRIRRGPRLRSLPPWQRPLRGPGR